MFHSYLLYVIKSPLNFVCFLNEYIFNNFSLNYNNPNYPVIDHKISVFEGYKIGMSEIEISNIDNLCITKRIINGKKGIISESIFRENFK